MSLPGRRVDVVEGEVESGLDVVEWMVGFLLRADVRMKVYYWGLLAQMWKDR
jgi:hypothetical protein